MIDSLATQKLLGEFRGEPAVDRRRLESVLLGLSALVDKHPEIVSVDINPLIITADGSPVAVDALVEIGDAATPTVRRGRPTDEQFRALFEPKGVLVAGASSHPGKFGFVSLHNILASGYKGDVFGTNLEGEEVLGIRTVADIGSLPTDAIDLVFVCTPAAANDSVLRACAAKGIGAAFLTSAGYGEAGEAGQRAEAELVALADELGMLLAGPNGQGLVSTPVGLCAQIVAPYPPRGRIAVASQSGNLVSSFLNYARQTGVGISRAVSAGNAAAVTPGDYIEWYADDAETAVSLAYVEGIVDGRALLDTFASVTGRKPLVVVKGGATDVGAKAAASHTGAMAADDKIFDGACRQTGVTRAATVEEAFDAAATFATQPLPKGPNVVVLTTAGGWGVVTSDALARADGLKLITLPADLMAEIDTKLPARWSRNNPVDCAGGETRDTIPEVMEMIAAHPDVHAVIYLGVGIQSNEARLMREGGFHPAYGLDRIVAYHERQDQRFAEAADELSRRYDKPILTATELVVSDPANPGPAAVRATGRLCYASGNRAVTALEHLHRYAEFRRRRGVD
jgi:acetyltransferase